MSEPRHLDLVVDDSEGSWEDLVRELIESDLVQSQEPLGCFGSCVGCLASSRCRCVPGCNIPNCSGSCSC